MNDLHDLLEQATDTIEPPGLAAGALAEARRRRTRSRGAASALVAAAAVLVLVVSVRVITGDPRTEAPPVDPASPTVTEVSTAPDVPRGKVQDRWDPRGAEALPVVDLGVPRVLPPAPGAGPVAEAVALLDDDQQPLLITGAGGAVDLDLPDGIGQWRSLALSPDGRRVAAIGAALFWRDLADGSWQRVERPRGIDVEARVAWLSSDQLVLSSYRTGVRVDLATGEQTRLPFARSTSAWAPAPDGGFVTYDVDGLVERSGPDGAGEARRTRTGEVGSLLRFVVGEDAVVSSRGNTTFPPATPAHQDGLIVLERGTLETRAMLPVPSDASRYADGGALSPLGWLDEDTVLFTVAPTRAPKDYLVAWDVATGELSRIACWPTSYDASFATDLLARR